MKNHLPSNPDKALKDETIAIKFFSVLRSMKIISKDKYVYFVVIGLEKWSLRRNNLSGTHWLDQDT